MARIVSICVHGDRIMPDLISTDGDRREIREQNGQRANFLIGLANQILDANLSNIDVVLLPGGFFKLPVHIGHLDREGRANYIENADFAEACRRVSILLNQDGSGPHLVVGVDSVHKPREDNVLESQDEFCVSWCGGLLRGCARKIFPSIEQFDPVGGQERIYICYAQDFYTHDRIIELPSGESALLCSCYDMWGTRLVKMNEQVMRIDKRYNLVRYVSTDCNRHVTCEDVDFHQTKTNCIDQFATLLGNRNVTVGLAAIHRFTHAGIGSGVGYWSKYGIWATSATLGGLAVGAAHFIPPRAVPNDACTLAARNVPENVLANIHNAAGYNLRPTIPPISYMEGEAVIRCFDSWKVD